MYDISANANLSDKAKALVISDRAQFDGNCRLAERLLRVNGTAYDGERGADVMLAITLQVNFQMSSGIAPYIESSSADKGTKQESVTYRSVQPLVDPRAQDLIDSVMADIEASGNDNSKYHTLRSVRTPCSR